jgi:hypothetical protein
MKIHPWKKSFTIALKLKEARKIAKKRRDSKWHKEHDDELTKISDAARHRKKYRLAHSIPLNRPGAKYD